MQSPWTVLRSTETPISLLAVMGAAEPWPPVQPLHLASGLSFPQRQLIWLLSLLVSGLVLWSQRNRTPGRERMLAALPLAALNLLVPLLFDGDSEVMANISAFIGTAAITNMKLLSWVMGRGSLTQPLTKAQFLAVYALPITPAEARTYLRHFLRKLAGMAGVVYVLHSFTLPRIPQLLMQGFSQYLGLSMTMDLLAAVVGMTTGLAVSPHFDNPYLSTSVADFWNRRWNLTVSNVLRAAIYDPIMDGRLVRRPGEFAAFSQARRMVAVLAVFAFSGLMHEVMFWYFSGIFTPHFMWFAYFTLWGLIITAENVAKKVLRKSGLQMPTILARIMTIAVVNIMVASLWWPPLDALGVPQRATEHVVDSWRTLQKEVLGRWRQ